MKYFIFFTNIINILVLPDKLLQKVAYFAKTFLYTVLIQKHRHPLNSVKTSS